MKSSEDINELCAALAQAQAKIKNPGLDKLNPHFRNKYSSLAAVLESIHAVAGAHGLSFSQHLSAGDIGLCCESVIHHASGQWMSETLELPVSKADAQGFASAATYARRISAQAIWGITGDDDDDGEAASKAAPTKQQTVDTAEVRAHLKAAALGGMEAYKAAWLALDGEKRGAVGQSYHTSMKELAQQQGDADAR